MKLCVALDLPTREENIVLAKSIESYAKEVWLKVGFRSYIRDGRAFLDELKEMGFKIFLDLKLYDIPNTMADAAEEIAKMGVDMFNIHASAGKAAIKAVMERLETLAKRPKVLAVTVLTSFDEETFEDVYGTTIANKADDLAKLSYAYELDGVVCSVFEAGSIKASTHKSFITLTPGIRPFGEEKDDQCRIGNIAYAKEQKVDFIVVGRPIYRADDPKAMVEKILQTL